MSFSPKYVKLNTVLITRTFVLVENNGVHHTPINKRKAKEEVRYE
jgi:hypothetical protein